MKRYFLLTAFFLVLQSCNQSEIARLESDNYDLVNQNSDLEFQIYNLQERNNELQERNNELLDVIYQIESATSDLEWELNRLSGEVDDFGWEEWRTNVWDVENQLFRVKSSFDELQSSIYY